MIGNKYKDETVIRFNSNASNTFDKGLDAMKFFSFNSSVPGIATMMDTLNLSVNSMPLLTDSISIPVKVQVGVSGTYTINLDNTSTLPSTSCLVLEDLVTGIRTDLRTTPGYSFYITNATTTPRFLIHIGATLQITASSVECNGGTNGSITAKGLGSGPWDYLWKDVSGNVIQTHNGKADTDTLYNLHSGSYTVEVNGNTGCSSLIIKQVIIEEPVVIAAQGFVSNSNCGEEDGSILILSTTGGTAPYVYNWSNGITNSDNLNIGKGTYTLTITDSAKCKQSFMFTVNKNPSVIAAFNIITDTVDLTINTPVGFSNSTSGMATYIWDFGDGSSVDNAVNPVHTYTVSGTYTVILIAFDGICSDTTTRVIVVLPDATGVKDSYASSVDKQVKIVSTDNSIDLIFDFDTSINAIINVYNSVGQQVVMYSNITVFKSRISIDFVGKAKGIYYIRIQVKDEIILRKTLKL
ncbi:MAG: PKD domain-containing protein [Bacteroidetes bacterium]|nr:PKD domain-containing protein [Bacteroidota bacterium]